MPSSVDAGRYTMNSGNALNFDIKMTFEKKPRCQRPTGTFGYVFILYFPNSLVFDANEKLPQLRFLNYAVGEFLN